MVTSRPTGYGPYLLQLAQRAEAEGFHLNAPASHSISRSNMLSDVHVSTSVRTDLISVNLNLMRDQDRALYQQLVEQAGEIARELQVPLVWENKEGMLKATLRTNLQADLADLSDWPRQHEWAIRMMAQFERVFVTYLSG